MANLCVASSTLPKSSNNDGAEPHTETHSDPQTWRLYDFSEKTLYWPAVLIVAASNKQGSTIEVG